MPCGCGGSQPMFRRRRTSRKRSPKKKLAFKEGPRGGRTRVTSVWFLKNNWTKPQAREWLRQKGMKPIKDSKVESKPNYWVFKIARKIKGARFRTIILDKKNGILAHIMAAGPEPRKRSSPRRRRSVKRKRTVRRRRSVRRRRRS